MSTIFYFLMKSFYFFDLHFAFDFVSFIHILDYNVILLVAQYQKRMEKL